jgi:hypothetical protein
MSFAFSFHSAAKVCGEYQNARLYAFGMFGGFSGAISPVSNRCDQVFLFEMRGVALADVVCDAQNVLDFFRGHFASSVVPHGWTITFRIEHPLSLQVFHGDLY